MNKKEIDQKLVKTIEDYVSKYFELENQNENKKILVDHYKEKYEKIFKKLIQERRDNNYKISEINNFKVIFF